MTQGFIERFNIMHLNRIGREQCVGVRIFLYYYKSRQNGTYRTCAPSRSYKMPFWMSIFAPLSYAFLRPVNIIYTRFGININNLLVDILLKIDQRFLSIPEIPCMDTDKNRLLVPCLLVVLSLKKPTPTNRCPGLHSLHSRNPLYGCGLE